MAITPNFSASQLAGNPAGIILTDTSTGSDVTVVARRVYLLQADGTYLVPSGTNTNYIVWAINQNTITINVLTQDTALNVTVDWVDINGNTVVGKTTAYGFDAFGQNFYYGLTQTQIPIMNPSQVLSTNYYMNKMIFKVYIDSAAQAIVYASDIYSAQICYDADQNMINNSNFYF